MEYGLPRKRDQKGAQLKREGARKKEN